MNKTGKQYNTEDIINAYQRDILDSFGVGFIRLGSEGGGSYSLAESKTSLHGLMLESDLGFITEQFNKDLIPQLLAINGIRLPEDEMPRLVVGDIDEPSVDEFSKAIQRAKAVGLISASPEVVRYTMNRLGYPKELLDSMSDEYLMEHLEAPTSRSGDGLESGMPDSTSTSTEEKGDTSVSNVEAGGSE